MYDLMNARRRTASYPESGSHKSVAVERVVEIKVWFWGHKIQGLRCHKIQDWVPQNQAHHLSHPLSAKQTFQLDYFNKMYIIVEIRVEGGKLEENIESTL